MNWNRWFSGNIRPPNQRPEVPKQHSEYGLRDNTEKWDLCPDAEEYLSRSIDKGAAIIVDDFLVVKFIGQLTALCIKERTMKGVHFKAGTWYAARGEVRDHLRADFDAGKRRVSYAKSEWTDLRKIDPSYGYVTEESLLSEAREYARDPSTGLRTDVIGDTPGARRAFQERYENPEIMDPDNMLEER